jgi:hypothetical protein
VTRLRNLWSRFARWLHHDPRVPATWDDTPALRTALVATQARLRIARGVAAADFEQWLDEWVDQ